MITTYLLLSQNKGVELNPILSLLINCFGLQVLILWFVIETLVIYFAMLAIRGLRALFMVSLKVEYIFLLLVSLVPAYNTFLLLSEVILPIIL